MRGAIDRSHSSLPKELLDLIFIVEYFHHFGYRKARITYSSRARVVNESLCGQNTSETKGGIS
jgi:hypothetical protein